MDFENKTHHSYRSEVVFVSLMTLIFGFCCLFFGYLTLPLAAGFYAALLSIEKKENRVLSYVIPLVLLVVNIFINGFYSFEAISYVAIGVIIFYGFDRRKNKAFFTFFACAALVLLIIISMVFIAFDKYGTFKLTVPVSYYSELYASGKSEFVNLVTSFTSVDAENAVYHNYNGYEAVSMYNSIVISLVPIIAIFTFLSTGVSSKILASRVRKYNPDDRRLEGWHFITSPFMAYSYLVLTALSGLSTQGIFGLSISFVSSILMAVYLYIGICATYAFIRSKKGSRFAILSIIVAFVVFFSFIPQIISFIGVFVNNIAYKNKSSDNSNIS